MSLDTLQQIVRLTQSSRDAGTLIQQEQLVLDTFALKLK